ncbi:hypothetical protein DIPPA_00011 [Diplonema papillatum]|nr:hypothetical protein DIPPA_00011 [Diplonema papillatum]
MCRTHARILSGVTAERTKMSVARSATESGTVSGRGAAVRSCWNTVNRFASYCGLCLMSVTATFERSNA